MSRGREIARGVRSLLERTRLGRKLFDSAHHRSPVRRFIAGWLFGLLVALAGAVTYLPFGPTSCERRSARHWRARPGS
jgi:hypothetical protein